MLKGIFPRPSIRLAQIFTCIMTSSILNRLLGVHTIPGVLLTVGLLIGVDGLPATAGQRAGSYTVETFRVGLAPFGLAFDGADIWVANGGSDTVRSCVLATALCLGLFVSATIRPASLLMEPTSGSPIPSATVSQGCVLATVLIAALFLWEEPRLE